MVSPNDASPIAADFGEPEPATFGVILRAILRPLASLKLTVVLFAMAIFIVFAGTLAQVEANIWEVIAGYFRTAFVWIPLRVFFPPSFFPGLSVPERLFLPGDVSLPLRIPFPGGWLIGGLMAINLTAAHAVRFKIHARGTRLSTGLAVIAAGLLTTWLVIVSGSNKSGLQEATWIEWSTLWVLFEVSLGAMIAAMAYAVLSMDPARKTERRTLIAVEVLLGGLLCWLLYQGDAGRLGDSSMRIMWQLSKATLAGLVLLVGCVMVFQKRAGIVLMHAGIGLMMLSELLVGLLAVEGQMQIDEGQTTNFVQDIRTLELAVVDPSPADHDEVVVIPESMLRSGGVIRHESLPFDVEVVKYLENSALRRVRADDDNLATAGAGLEWIADKTRKGAGTDSGGGVDMAAAYVRFSSKDGAEDLGTRLLSLLIANQGTPEELTLDGTTYHLSLRFKRTYKPYSMHLIDVRKDDYLGTNTPRNYSSDIRLVDESGNVDRQTKIWMNNPLRFAGETFYQSGYYRNPQTGKETTTLAVVTNTGWMIPYVSCMIVATGLLAHFWIVLLRFLNRRPAATSETAEIVEFRDVPHSTKADKRKRAAKPTGCNPGAWKAKTTPVCGEKSPGLLTRLFPMVVVIIFAGLLAYVARPPGPAEGEMNLYEFGKLPLVYEGRVKPFDTLARNSLRIISDRQTFVDASGKRQPAIRWLLDVMTGSEDAEKHRVFRIQNLRVLETLGLKRREHFRYAIGEFRAKADEFNEQAKLARQLDAADLSVYQRKILELDQRVGRYTMLQTSFRAQPFPAFPTDEEYKQDRSGVTKRVLRIKEMLDRARADDRILARMQPPLAVPVLSADTESEDSKWLPHATAWTQAFLNKVKGEETNPATLSLNAIFNAYAEGDAETFNRELAKYQSLLAHTPPQKLDTPKTDFEVFFNHFEPFFYCAVLYVVAFILACLAWLVWNRPLNRASFWLIALTLLVHTFALISRIYISGRPPVTNLYSSAVFIGWGCVILGLVFEVIYRMGVGNIIATVTGFNTLLIAHFLAGDGDTFVVLQAVLDTQFWLATHVTCITLGYSTTFLAGMLGVLHILRGVATPTLSPKVSQNFSRMIYGTLCFAIFFSFVGTVLGGLWADDSWGRFWGWDPKENGALIIVLWNALVLHARWGGMVKERGMAILAVGGNIVTSWSWFGVNELGVGLHSYGFTEGVLRALFLFVASQLAVMFLGAMPQSMWWSARVRRT